MKVLFGMALRQTTGRDGPENLRLCATDFLFGLFGVALDRFGPQRVGDVQAFQRTRLC